MTQDELISRISAGADVTKKAAGEMVAALATAVREELARGGEVTIPTIAKFSVADKPARTGRNPATGEAIEIPAHRAPKIKPLKALRDVVAAS